MKRILAALLAASMLFAVSACGDKKDSAEEHARKLASGEIEPDAEVDKNAEKGTDADKSANKITLETDVDGFSAIVDAFDEDYKSIEAQPISSADFFIGKQLRLAAHMKDHQMTMMYDQDIKALFTQNTLTMNYVKDEKPVEVKNLVYEVSDPVTTPGGRNYIYVNFGSHPLTEDNKAFSTDCLMLVKMVSDKVDMGDAKADTYVLLIESAMSDQYELFKVEE